MSYTFDWNLLAGDWYNELGSLVTFTPDSTGGLSGCYNSAVGDAKYLYVLTGRFDTNPPRNDENGNPYGVSVGWAVTWLNDKVPDANSTTTWSGQYFDATEKTEKRIVTHWLLTLSTGETTNWDSTTVGTDTFVRTKPSDAEIAKAKMLRIASPDPQQILAKK